jgi:3-deoxy-manno-octulosonate cytidylyltransferase (CMP-KDO synthetase)
MRLPGKPLIDLKGKPMIQRVYEQAGLSAASRVVVATDDERIQAAVESFGGEVCLTRADHVSGTDRVHEVVEKLGLPDEQCVINVQGDEPLIPPAAINQVAELMAGDNTLMATLCEPIDLEQDYLDPNIVKVVRGGHAALYFSRAPVPLNRDHPTTYQGGAFRHIGIYGYQARLLRQFVTWPEATLEKTEKLEQLRVLENGVAIAIAAAACEIPPGIDTARDLERTLAVLED